MNIQDQQRGEISLTWFTELMKCQQFREAVQERYQHTMRPLLENWSETCNDYRSTLENSPGSRMLTNCRIGSPSARRI